jgi:hypothetical protein
VHAGDAGEQAVDLSQSVDEPGDGDDLATVLVEERLGAVQSLRGQKDVSAEPLREGPATEVADDEADVVADDGGEHRDQKHHRDVHLACTGEDRGGDQHDFAGHGNPEVLEEQHPADAQVPVVLEHRLHVSENTRKLGVGHGCNRKFIGPRFRSTPRTWQNQRWRGVFLRRGVVTTSAVIGRPALRADSVGGRDLRR